MANRYTHLRNYAPYINPYNFDLIQSGLEYKQAKVDANRASIGERVDKIIGLDIVKPESRDYLIDKVSQLVNNVNQTYEGADLSNDNVSRGIESLLSQAIDSNVLNAYSGTLEYRRVREEIDDIKRNKPEFYSETNEWFALRSFHSWMEDGDVGSRLAPLTYSPYVDYNKSINEKMKEFQKNSKGQTITLEDPNNPGRLIKTTSDMLTESQVRHIVSQNLSQQERAQMRIDGSYAAATNPGLFDVSTVDEFINRTSSNYDREILALKAQLKGVGDDNELRTQINEQIRITEGYKENYATTVRNALGSNYNPEVAGSFIVEQRVLDGAAAAWSYDNSSLEYEVDKNYWERLNYNLRYSNSLIDNEYKRVLTEKALSEIKGNTGNEGIAGTVSNFRASDFPEINSERILQESISNYGNLYNSNIGQIWDKLGTEGWAEVNSAIDLNYRGKPQYANFSENDLTYQYFKDNGGATNELLARSGLIENYVEATKAYERLQQASQYTNQLEQQKSQIIKSPETVSALSRQAERNPDLPIYTPDGRKISAGYAIQNGLSYGGYSAETLSVAAATAQNYLDNVVIPFIGNRPFGRGIGIDTNVDSALFSKEQQTAEGNIDPTKIRDIKNITDLNVLASIVGETITPDEIFDIDDNGNVSVKPYKSGEKYTTTLLRSAFNDNTSKALNSNDVKGQKDEKRDSRWTSDGGVKRILNPANDPSLVRSVADSYVNEVQTPLSYTFSSAAPNKSQEKDNYINAYNIYTAQAASTGLDLNKLKKPTVGSGNATIFSVPQEGGGLTYRVMLNSDIENSLEVSPEILIANGFDVGQRSVEFPVTRMNPVSSKISYSSDTNTSYPKYLSTLGIDYVATKTDVKQRIYNKFSDLIYSYNQGGQASPTILKSVVDDIINNSNKFEVELSGYEEFGQKGVKVNFYHVKDNPGSREPFYTYDQSGIEYADNFVTYLQAAPQIFLLTSLEGLLYSQQLQSGGNFTDIDLVSGLNRFRENALR